MAPMERARPTLSDAQSVAAYNWQLRADQLNNIAKAMGDTPAARVLQQRATEYLLRAQAGDPHDKDRSQP